MSDGAAIPARTKGLGLLVRFSKPHRSWLLLGGAGSIGVVAARLAIPWPLRWVIELAGDPERPSPFGSSPAESLVLVALVYLGLSVFLGASEFVQRIQLGRFTALLVDDLRSAAMEGAKRGQLASEVGDVTARVIGDSARLRNDVTGILVHASTNGLLYLAACSVMLWVSWVFGALFLASGAVAVWIGVVTSRSVAETASRQRKKEGRYAASIQAELEGSAGPFGPIEDLSRKSRSKEMRSAKRTGRSMLWVHTILGAAVSVGLWFGVQDVWSGGMAPGDLFVFAAYALTIHRRMVQVGRQSARSGKVVATANRLGGLIALETQGDSEVASSGVGLRLERVKVGGGTDPERKVRLRRLDLDLPRGSHSLVAGAVGSGKTSLLELLAGQQPAYRGRLHWDDAVLTAADVRPAGIVGFVSRNPVFPSRELWQLVGLADPSGPTAEEKTTLRRLGAWPAIRRISGSWTARLSSREVSTEQARLIALSNLVLGQRFGAWVVDGALENPSTKKASARAEEILQRAGWRTVVLSCSRAIAVEKFDRLIEMERAHVVYDGAPGDWMEARTEKVPA